MQYRFAQHRNRTYEDGFEPAAAGGMLRLRDDVEGHAVAANQAATTSSST